MMNKSAFAPRVSLDTVSLPDFGLPPERPQIPLETYQRRIAATLQRMEQQKLDVLVVYADREHCANISWLIEFEPRFEESILLLHKSGKRTLLVGNECLGYLPHPQLECDIVLFQDLSLLGQPRDSSQPLRTIFSDFGIGKGIRVGTVGWKYYTNSSGEEQDQVIEIPSYLVDLLREMTAESTHVTNATQLFMNLSDGLRLFHDATDIAFFEYASCQTSTSVHNLIQNLEIGVRENALQPHLQSAGLPYSCHPMIGFGEKAQRGLASPSDNHAQMGDPYTVAFGVTGALTCRAGCIARGPQDLPPALADFYPQFAANFFSTVATWYQQVQLGVSGGTVFEAVDAVRDDSLFRFLVNPGHYIDLDEWVHSPFYKQSPHTLKSGMTVQMDIIPVSQGPFCYSNVEDGIVVADEELRADLASKHPECWLRIEKRREFMREALGIALHETLLPLSNIPAWLPPYALNCNRVFVCCS